MEIPDCLSAPDLILENEELEKRISEGFEQLPETLKETMVLRHVKDMPYEKNS
jgi:DNA-directed RNA polymerase specialized sigma24 family protein